MASTFDESDDTVINDSEPHFDGSFTNIGAVDAHWGTERVFEFYKSLGRNSIDGEGGEIVSVVNAGDVGGDPDVQRLLGRVQDGLRQSRAQSDNS